MRLRHTVGAAFGALALVLTVPTSSHAANGFFQYQYGDPANPQSKVLKNPASRSCHNIAEVQGKRVNAFAPRNKTDEEVSLFAEEDCNGDYTDLKPGAEDNSKTRTFKSVLFNG
ncbi:hypothetical protein [Streptomyces aureocirculatus]|uniref:hypothetical protein n=1 Tax=Streptomyces aureocirculatus TaxID=67275 RepID=UPI0004C64DBD|nr:hypothetical protein [Streptomyces aureocirculatus]